MASNVSRLYIDDDSPQVAYFPSVNLEPSPNVTAGWQLQYSGSGAATVPGEVGVGTGYHLTTLNGSSLMIQWNGTGIDLMGTVSNASCSLTVDGLVSPACTTSNTILASVHDLVNTNHTLLLTSLVTNPDPPDAFLEFDRAIITYAPPREIGNTTATSYNISDQDIAFMGRWSYLADRNGSFMHLSTTAGDHAQTTFVGSAISVYGLVSSFSGQYSVTIDNVTTSMSAQSSYNNSNALLYFATELSQEGSHSLTITNQDNRVLALRVDGMNVTAYGNITIPTPGGASGDSTPAGTIAAATLAAVLFLLLSGLFYRFCVKRRSPSRSWMLRVLQRRNGTRDNKTNTAVPQTKVTPPSREEDLESNTLSASKGYGFGLGLRRGFPFAHQRSKPKSNTSGKSGSQTRCECHAMTCPDDRDDKRFSLSTLAADIPVLSYVPESEKLAPGWSNPAARSPHPSDLRGRPGIEEEGSDDGDDDAKTLTSRQGEALAATLSLSPRTSEAPAAFYCQPGAVDVMERREPRQPERSGDFLQVREMSPFRLDVGAIPTTFKGKRDSRSSGSSGSTWSKVRARLYRRAHKDDGRQSFHSCPAESSSSGGPELVPVVMHNLHSDALPSDTVPVSGTYSFLDFASSRRPSGSQMPSSALPEAGDEQDVVRMVMMERNGAGATLEPKPDAPSTASGGTNGGSASGLSTSPSFPSAQTVTTQGSSAPFPFPVSIPPSVHIPHPFNSVSLAQDRGSIPSPLVVDRPQVYVDPPSGGASSLNSPTESVPFTVSDIDFRNSFSDYTAMDSRRTSANSGLPLPPHPPLPHWDRSRPAPTPAQLFASPPPYIVQRVLGIAPPPTAPPPASAPARVAAGWPALPPPSSSSQAQARTPLASFPGVSVPPRRAEAAAHVPAVRPTFRMGGLLGPRPRPPNLGSSSPAASPPLPLQGGRGHLRGTRS